MGLLVRDDGEQGKDQPQVISLAVILYVLYTYTQRVLLWYHFKSCWKELYGVCHSPDEGLLSEFN